MHQRWIFLLLTDVFQYFNSKHDLVAVCWTRFPNVWRQRRWNYWLSRVSLCAVGHFTRQTGTEIEMGFLHVRSGWQRLHLTAGNAWNCYSTFYCYFTSYSTSFFFAEKHFHLPYQHAEFVANLTLKICIPTNRLFTKWLDPWWKCQKTSLRQKSGRIRFFVRWIRIWTVNYHLKNSSKELRATRRLFDCSSAILKELLSKKILILNVAHTIKSAAPLSPG